MMRADLRGLLAAIWAGAVTASGAAQADSACIPDGQRYCSAIPIGDGRILTCLQSRWKDLSSSCQQEIQNIQNRSREINAACANDVWQYCRDVAPGAGRIRVCLWSRWNDLSSTCRDKAAEVAEKTEALQQQCAADMERVCPGMKPGGGLIYMCLKAQESRISSGCRSALR
ncbi:MAG TPA: cysteine rich repeat-containing protein [Myxococcales bacterium]|jgi:hypothetical protein|nr:cysteine rich repeat-containing protein [Myxococcales bacterium]